jgi:hypothetical protein
MELYAREGHQLHALQAYDHMQVHYCRKPTAVCTVCLTIVQQARTA